MCIFVYSMQAKVKLHGDGTCGKTELLRASEKRGNDGSTP